MMLLSFYLPYFTYFALVSSSCQRGKDKATLVHLARFEGASYEPQAIVSPQPSVSAQEDLYEDRNNSNHQNFDEDNSIIVEKAVMCAWKNGPDNKPTKVAASPSTSLFSSNSSSDESISITQQEQRKRRSLKEVRVSAIEFVSWSLLFPYYLLKQITYTLMYRRRRTTRRRGRRTTRRRGCVQDPQPQQ